MRLFIFILMQVLVFLPAAGFADGGKALLTENHNKTEVTGARKAAVVKNYGKLPLYFIENKGQVDNAVKFYERGAGHATFFTNHGVVIGLTKRDVKAKKTSRHELISKDLTSDKAARPLSEAVSLSFVGANPKAKISADDKRTGRVNYFIGNDRSKWRTGIPTFGAVTYRDVYKNIDIKFYGNNRRLEHDIIVRPGGDFSLVKFAYKGAQGLKVTEDGGLEVAFKDGKIIEKKPVIYQEIGGRRVAVEGSYRLLGKKDGAFEYGFDVASYDHSKKLVIDPVLVYSTYWGGSFFDYGYSIDVDNSGSVYVAGNTASIDFPLMSPLQSGIRGGYDCFVSKLNPSGTAIVYSTYIGGTNDDSARGITIDASGTAYLTGETLSTHFPLVNPLQPRHGGGSYDAFVTQLDQNGSAILYSTYLGGGGNDSGFDIAVDASGNAYVTGLTSSEDFPLKNTLSGFGGGIDAFVTEISASGTAIVYSTYLGGVSEDDGLGIAVDSSGNAYVTGETNSTDFPVVKPLQATLNGNGDAFVTEISASGTAIVYSTYLGGSSVERGYGIAVEESGAAYVTGTTFSTDFPLVNPLQGAYGGSGIFGGDAFIAKIKPSGSGIAYSSYIGGSDSDAGLGIAVDSSGAAYLTGFTESRNFPLANPIQAIYGGGGFGAGDVFIAKINPAGSAYFYSTYLGGKKEDQGNSIALDNNGNAFVSGTTFSMDFPVANPLQGIRRGEIDAFITKISDASPPPVFIAISPDVIFVSRGSTLGYTVTATNTTATTQCFNYWETVTLPNGSTYPPTGTLFGPVHLCLNAGASQTTHLTHGVPMSALVGAYVFNAYVGAYPIAVVDEAHFNFDVTAFGPVMKRPETSWRLIENGFRK